jgi:uroporphyrin-3 C-methyltransferase
MNSDTPTEAATDAVSKTPASSELHTESVKQIEETKPSQPSRSSGRWGILLAFLAVLIALGLGAAGYYFWRQMDESANLLTQRLEQSESRLLGLQTGTQRLRTEIFTEIDKRVLTLQTTQQDLQESMRALNAQVRQKTGVSTVLAEAEYLLRSANNHLLLDRDVGTAVAALTAADERLRATGDPDVLKVRGLLASEINALSALQKSDTEGLALTLGTLIDSINQLPLTVKSSTPLKAQDKPRADDWRSLLSNIWSSLKSLVVVRYDNKTAEPLIAPEQSYYLYQNLRLQLETARLALLQRDTPTFRATLNTARNWLNTYFVTDAAITRNMLDTLGRLSATDISPPLPEISASLKALVSLMEDKATQVPVISSEAAPNDLTEDIASPSLESEGITEVAPPLKNNSGMLQP